MSHVIRAKTNITDKSVLLRALDSLKWTAHDRGSYIEIGSGQLSLKRNSDNTWTIVGDPWGDTQLSKYYGRTRDLVTDLQAHYNIALAQDRLEALGYTWIENQEAETNEQGDIQLVFERAD